MSDLQIQKSKDPLKPVRFRIAAELKSEANFREKVGEENFVWQIKVPTTEGNYYLFFYGDATVVRSPESADAKIPVQLEIRDKSRAPGKGKNESEKEKIFFQSGKGNHFTPGLFIMKDGRIIVTRPEHGWNIEVISHGNPYDMGMNYKCHS